MAGLKTYEVTVNGFRTALRLSDADARARGLLAPPARPGRTPARSAPKKNVAAAPNKARPADDIENK